MSRGKGRNRSQSRNRGRTRERTRDRTKDRTKSRTRSRDRSRDRNGGMRRKYHNLIVYYKNILLNGILIIDTYRIPYCISSWG